MQIMGSKYTIFGTHHQAHTKHIEVDFYIIRERVTNRDVQLRYISTIDRVVDIFTKGHTAAHFHYLRTKLKVCSPISLPGGVKLLEDTSLSDTTRSSQSLNCHTPWSTEDKHDTE
jgi:hypothetical protein